MNIKISVLMLALFSILVAHADELSADEQAVWHLENAYWEYVKNNDIAGYRSLWDENFVGWPGFSQHPIGKDNIHEWIEPLHDNPDEEYDYTLTLHAVRSFGDVVVAHYLVVDLMRSTADGEILSSGTPDRITHTWQRRGDTWQIITGMSGTLSSD